MHSATSLVFILLFIYVASGEGLTPQDLMKLRNQVKIVDFRGEQAHDLFGYIEGSIPVPSAMDEAVSEELR